MTETAEKPDIRELVGVAVNSSRLDASPLCERALDRVAGLGAAALEVSVGADLAGLPIAAMAGDVYRSSVGMREVMLDPGTPDARDQLAGELAPLLWHIRYGAQHGLLPQAIRLYAHWLQTRRLFAAYAGDVHRVFRERFCACVLHEWLSDRCVICGGSGRLEITITGGLIRPRGNMQRNARFTVCRTRHGGGCGGSGRAVPSHTLRAKWLELDRATYEAERWAQKFSAALIWLKQFHAARLYRPLTTQLERRKRRD
jgi:hypothetical protein